jgi:hypothetical protein
LTSDLPEKRPKIGPDDASDMKSSLLTTPTNPQINRTAKTRRRDLFQAVTVDNFNGGAPNRRLYNKRGLAVMKLQFLLTGIVATGLFASAPDTVAHGGFGGGGGHGGGGFHGGGGGFHGGRFGDFHGARFGEFRGHRFFFQQFAWPIYWYPYYPYDYSYLDYGPDNNYQYWDSSAASVQPESFRSAVDHGPVVVVINTGNSRPMD